MKFHTTHTLSYSIQKWAFFRSVDESYIDLTGTEKLWGGQVQTVKGIQQEIVETLNLPVKRNVGHWSSNGKVFEQYGIL